VAKNAFAVVRLADRGVLWFYGGDGFHLRATVAAEQRVGFIHGLDQNRPPHTAELTVLRAILVNGNVRQLGDKALHHVRHRAAVPPDAADFLVGLLVGQVGEAILRGCRTGCNDRGIELPWV
jgi:hypothetical protein